MSSITPSTTLMQPIKFGSKKVLQVKDPIYTGHINKELKNYSIVPTDRNYKFLDNNNLHYLKINKHLISLSGFGKKCILFLTKINGKNYCFYINKKTGDIVYVRHRFKDEIFTGTIFDGEIIKDENNNWIFSITDIMVYKGNTQDKTTLIDRIEIMNNIISTEYKEDHNLDVARIEIKKYFEYEYLNDLYNTFKPSLSYRCSGFIFKNIMCNDKYLLHIFEENRTKKAVEESKLNTNTSSIIAFKINKTELPDIYELHCSKDGSLYKYGYAGVTTLAKSKYLIELFEKSGGTDIYVKCSFHQVFKKWMPYDIANYISDYQTVENVSENI